DSDDAHPHRPDGHFVGDGADDHRWRAVGHRLTVHARLAVGAIGTRLAVGAVRVLVAVGIGLAVRPSLPIRAVDAPLVVGVGLAVPALAVSLISLRVRLTRGGGPTPSLPPGSTVPV